LRSYKLLCVLLLFVCALVTTSCSGNSSSGSSGDWKFKSVIWKGDLYVASTDVVTEVENEIGAIEEYSDDENFKPSKIFSNKYPVGTKLFKIPGISISESFAIEYENKYIVANNSGKYGSR
jgi:hypothetical protein